jgi:aminoglycoside phosphotransferase (APT) family kinase protein
VQPLREWAASTTTLEAVTDHPRLIHGDLKAGQVFVTPDGYRIIDWQRPMIGPPEVDLVSLLAAEGIDPRSYADPAIVRVFWFLLLHWAVKAQFELFPDFRGNLFEQWCSAAIHQILDENPPAAPEGIPPP